VKVRFTLDPEDWHGWSNEGLWAEPIVRGASGLVCSLMNSPFYIRSVCYLDIVRALPVADTAEFAFADVVERGGHSTYMIACPLGSGDFAPDWLPLEQLGCSYESKSIKTSHGPRMLYSVDIPARTNIQAAYKILEEGERRGVWFFQEGHVAHQT